MDIVFVNEIAKNEQNFSWTMILFRKMKRTHKNQMEMKDFFY